MMRIELTKLSCHYIKLLTYLWIILLDNFYIMRPNRPKFGDNHLSGSTTLDLPSNLLQHRKSAIR
jgi:hypothetical protein